MHTVQSLSLSLYKWLTLSLLHENFTSNKLWHNLYWQLHSTVQQKCSVQILWTDKHLLQNIHTLKLRFGTIKSRVNGSIRRARTAHNNPRVWKKIEVILLEQLSRSKAQNTISIAYTLKMEAASSFKTSVNMHKSIQSHARRHNLQSFS
jgi:hypothetical protein